MKMNHKSVLIILCLVILTLVLCCCNAPKNSSQPSPTAAAETESDDEFLLNNNAGSENPESGSEVSEPEEEEVPMIVNPGRSSLPKIDLASDNPLKKPAAFQVSPVRNAQIVRPETNDNDLVIRNDHTITYPESQSVIQKSVPSGKLQPLGYIPPAHLANGQSINFGYGETSAVISGYVPAGGVVSYNLYAFANQNFLVLLSSDSGTSVLSISDVYGNVFLDANQRQTSYNMYLPRTATYYVNIHSTGYSENFTLQIFIPARVVIPAGQTSTAMDGSIGPYGVVGYTAYMYAGQTARIDDYSGPNPTSFLRVSGLQTGIVYMDYTSYSPSWYSVVPATQDYLIEVISMDLPSTYRLTVDVR